MVSWFSPSMKLVIRAESFESKQGSENAQVKAMIENCGLSNKVFTLDALPCSRETTRAIIESKNDYLVTVKGNQIKLYNRLKTLAKTEKPLTVNQSKEFSHGRCVSRKVSVFDGQNVNSKNYPHRQSFIEVERKGFRGKKEYNETLYYISSKILTAEIFGEKIREHWLIENQVHWVKDVIFNEDKSKIKEKGAAQNFSIFLTIIMNIYRSLGFISIKKGQYGLGSQWEKLLAIAEIRSG
jgi:predicted transposase YbfD/YdcC